MIDDAHRDRNADPNLGDHQPSAQPAQGPDTWLTRALADRALAPPRAMPATPHDPRQRSSVRTRPSPTGTPPSSRSRSTHPPPPTPGREPRRATRGRSHSGPGSSAQGLEQRATPTRRQAPAAPLPPPPSPPIVCLTYHRGPADQRRRSFPAWAGRAVDGRTGELLSADGPGPSNTRASLQIGVHPSRECGGARAVTRWTTQASARYYPPIDAQPGATSPAVSVRRRMDPDR